MTDVVISLYHNEALREDYSLRVKKAEYASVKKPTFEQTDPMDITGATFTATAKFGAQVLTLTVVVVDPAIPRIQLQASQTAVKAFKGKTGTWDLIMTKNSIPDRLFGGPIEVLAGTS